MEKETKDEGIKKEQKEDTSNKLKQRNEEGKKKTINSPFFIPVSYKSFSSPTWARNHDPHSHSLIPLRY